jgi:hypothetical protein
VVISVDGFSDLIDSKDGKDLHWTTQIDKELPIKMAPDSSSDEFKPETIPN